MKQLLVFLLLVTIFSQEGYAQLPTCDKIYIKVSGTYNTRGIYTYEPTLPVSTSNPKFNTCSEPPGFTQLSGLGLAVSPHLGTNDPRLTFYSTNFQTKTFSYYNIDSAKWMNTGDSIGGNLAVNIGAGGGYIYSIDINGNVFRYSGVGKSRFIVNVSDAVNLGPADIVVDCQGNFYLLRLPTNNINIYFFRKYSSIGILLQSWAIANPNNISIPAPGAGMAILRNQIYFDNGNTSTGGNISYATVGTNSVMLDSTHSFKLVGDDDMASCSGFTLTLPSITIAPLQNPLCSGSAIRFTSTTTLAGSTPKYQWMVNGTKSGTDSTGFSYVPSDGDTVQCMLMSSDYCASQVNATSNAVVVTVLPYTTPSVSIAASDTGIICAGTSVLFNSTSSNVGNLPSYQWYKTGNAISGATLASYTAVNPTTADSFFVIVHSTALCNLVDSAISAKAGIQVGIPHPFVTISNTNPPPLCSGTTITIQATASYPGKSPVYSWMVNGRPWSGISFGNAIISNALQNQDTIALTMQSSIACATPNIVAAPPLILTITPTVVPGCNINITPGTAMCVGSRINFVTNTVAGGNAPAFQWLRNGIPWLGANGANYSSTTLSAGDTVSILFSSSELCASPDTVLSNKVDIRLDSVVYPTASIESLPGTQIAAGTRVTFLAHTTFGGKHPTFQWLKNGVAIPFATDSFYTSSALKDGDEIGLDMLSSVSCPTTVRTQATMVQIHITTGLGNYILDSSMAIYPNPNRGTFTIMLGQAGTGYYKISDLAGQLIYQNSFSGKRAEVVLPNSLGSGLYFVRLSLEDGRVGAGKVVLLR